METSPVHRSLPSASRCRLSELGLEQVLAAEVMVALVMAMATAKVTVLQAMKAEVRVTRAPVILVAWAFVRLAPAPLPLAQTPKMARPGQPADCRRPTSADKHQTTNSACEFEPAHPSYRLQAR